MIRRLSSLLIASVTVVIALGCKQTPPAEPVQSQARTDSDLVGQWRAKLQFKSGAFASIQDLEFMYVFNNGGTMTESSNYDVAPPVPPAYGIWRKTGEREFEAKYEFFLTKSPTDLSLISQGGGWLPIGRGVLTEKIKLSDNGDSFTSSVRYEPLDSSGAILDGGGGAAGRGVRLKF